MPRLWLVPIERTCRKCGSTKPSDLFAKSKHNLCKVCHAEYVRRRSTGNAALAEKRRVKYREQKAKDPFVRYLKDLRSRSRALGIPFELTKDDLFVPEFCPVLGIRLTRFGEKVESSPELDRLVPHLGYVRCNVQIVSRRANRIKNDGTAEEHERIAAWMRSRGVK